MGVIRQFVTIRAHFFQKTAGIQRAIAVAGCREPGGEQEEHVLGPRAGHVEEAAFLLDVPFVDGAGEGEEAVGAVTSVARHHDEGPIALALLKRTTPVDAPLVVAAHDGQIAAAQETIVPPDAGRTAAVPRLPRLARRR